MPIPLRPDFDATSLRSAARASKDAGQARRLLALAAIYEGDTRTQAAAIGGVTLQVIRDWVMRFNAHGPDGLIDRKAPGQPSRLDDEQRAALAAMIESGPVPAVHGLQAAPRPVPPGDRCAMVGWRLVDLCQWVWDKFRVSVSRQTLGRELRAMRYRKLSARPRHHGQAEGAIETFKETFPPCWMRSRARQVSRSATSNSGSATVERQRRSTASARRTRSPGAGPSLATPRRDNPSCACARERATSGLKARHAARSAARSAHRLDLHLRCDLPQGEGGRPRPAPLQHRGDDLAPGRHISRSRPREVAPGQHAVLLVEQAGWHTSAKLHVPDNITLVPPRSGSGGRLLPAKCPELNAQENVWQFMRDNWLSNRIFTGYDNLVDHCCDAWNSLVEQPWRIMSLGLRDWPARLGTRVLITGLWYKLMVFTMAPA